MLPNTRILTLTLLSTLASSVVVACGGGSDSSSSPKPPTQQRTEGQSEFESAPPVTQGGGGGVSAGSSSGGGVADEKSPAPAAPGNAQAQQQEAKAQETDLYRVEGNRLYYLNSYRGLMVFDITNVDDPKLLGRSPVFGTPVEMYVQNGVATMVIGDWYGTADDGSPFHGSVVRTVDAKNPADIQVKGEVQVKGWARDMRVVGSNLFIVSEDYGWSYGYWGWGPYGGYAEGDVAAPGGYYYGGTNSKVVISSVRFGDTAPKLAATKEFDGYSGAFNVSAHEILMAHDVLVDDAQGNKVPSGKSAIDYIAFSQLDGSIVPMGSFQVDGTLNNWSADNGRWNIDLDGTTASVITCLTGQYGYCDEQQGYELTTIDFSNASAPQKLGSLAVPSKGWGATARFANKRMYLSPREGAWNNNGQQQPTPIEVYDLSTPATPKLAGSTTISGAVWLFMPSGTDRVFALGNEYGNGYSSSSVAVRMLDVSDATQPKVLGTASFGDGWAWTPANGTFKAFVRDDAQKLIVLPFSGWSSSTNDYMNGVQLIEYDTSTIAAKGAARSKGWVERGVFVKNRVISLSDQSLSVVDYGDKANPKVVKELTLARNVISAQPSGATIAQLSTDWYGYDNQTSELRVLPIANAEESMDDPSAKSISIDGTDARVFRNGDLAYVVTTKYPGKNWNGPWYATPHVQIVDLSGGNVTPKGSIDLPEESNGSYWSWWGGCYYWDWYEGGAAVQVGGDSLAFRRIHGEYDQNTGVYKYDQKLYVLDLSDPNAPKLASTAVSTDPDAWWGNMKVVGNTLYTTHYEYVQKPTLPTNPNDPKVQYWVRYYLDQIDLTDRANPKIGQRINVPGMLVGASDSDPSMLYFVDYRWYDNYANGPKDEIAVAKIDGGKAYLQSSTLIDGWVGNVFVRGNKAYMSAQQYTDPTATNPNGTSTVQLHELDLSDPKKPADRVTTAKDGWGWLVGVEGDRALITSGWGQVGLDIYRLNPGQAPTYSQFARTRGWWTNAMTRQGNDLFLSSGYWGVQKITLQ